MQILVTALYAYGFVVSAVFCLTWYPLALRALWRGQDNVSTARIIDYAGLPLALCVSFALILRNLAVHGMASYSDDLLTTAGRLVLPATLCALLTLRLVKWGLQLWRRRHQGTPVDPLASVSRDGGDPQP